MVTMLFMGVYTIVDTIFVARFAGTNALSALNIMCPVIKLIVGLSTMFATGEVGGASGGASYHDCGGDFP